MRQNDLTSGQSVHNYHNWSVRRHVAVIHWSKVKSPSSTTLIKCMHLDYCGLGLTVFRHPLN